MKRIILGLCVALVTFGVGVGCELAFEKYLAATSPADCSSTQPGVLVLTYSVPLDKSVTDRPGSLAAVLQRIDDRYRMKCQLPTDWNGDWPTVKQLDRFRLCNDEWANARREAIDYELRGYMVCY